jgi:catechol 2,3-dioxygenase-like lactoylglutathione lyase family enzyme
MKIWHVAFAVPDLEQAMAELGDAMELTWRPVREVRLTLNDEQGSPHDVLCKVTFSHQGGPAIELFESVPGTPLAESDGSAFHHLGGWVDDVAAEGARLEQLGWPCFASADLSTHSVNIDIRRGPNGIRAELCGVHQDRPSMRDLFPSTSPHYRAPERP